MFSSGVLHQYLRKALVPLLILAIGIPLVNRVISPDETASAQDGPDRVIWITVDSTDNEWWLAYWSNNHIACQFTIDHDGPPTPEDVLLVCGSSVYQEWLDTQACNAVDNGGSTSSCKGLYLQQGISQQSTNEIQVELPAPEVWISISGNLIDSTENKWAGEPSIILTGEEKIANERIVQINGVYDGIPFSCEGDTCELPLATTGDRGVTLTFWGASSYGDSTEEYTALLRVLPWGETTEGSTVPQRIGYYVDIISPQWRGQHNSTCAGIWQSFPPVEGLPDWLDTPDTAAGLSSSVSLHYLAAMLIQNGEVDASDCPGGGLDYPTAANLCGVEKAETALNDWQNQFDEEILVTSTKTGIPAKLLKNIFAHESQLWPGIYHDIEEAGLGQLTEEGADTALLWNPDFYAQFCPLVLLDTTCEKGYATLPDDQRAILRGALVKKVNATCADCPMGIDLTQANFSVGIFGETLVGNCAQVDRMMYNLTRQTSGLLTSYTDLWRFTLINYNAGPGCLWTALERTWKAGDPLDWIHVAANLEPACQGAVEYAKEVSEGDTAGIAVFSTMVPSPTPTITLTPRPVRPTSTPRPTSTSANTRTPTPTGTIRPTNTGTLTVTPSPTSTLTPTPTVTPSSGW